MKLVINGKEETVPDGLNVVELLKEKDVEMPDMVSVELNGAILDREVFQATMLGEHDQIEFLYFMGGGQDETARF